jgi:hypothetical protein
MIMTRFKAALWFGALLIIATPLRAEDNDGQPNALSEQEAKQGWKLLFDGKTTAGWRAYRGKDIPEFWKVVDGALVCSPKHGKNGADLVTEGRYSDFELAFEWKVTAGANSGLMYRVAETEDEPWKTGPEYQILDNAKHSDGKRPKTTAASCYALFAPSEDRTRPVGEWNHGRIVVAGQHVEHWLNGKKVVEFDFGSDEWNQRVGKSKFRVFPRFGKEEAGHIDLQFHDDEASFRSIKILPLEDKK